jgi:hypothetical protein
MWHYRGNDRGYFPLPVLRQLINIINAAVFRCVMLDVFPLHNGIFSVACPIGIALGSISAFARVEIVLLRRRRITGKQQKHIKGLALLALMMFGALSIIVTGCSGSDDGDSTTINQQTLVGTWGITGSHTDNYSLSGTISLSADGALTYELVQLNHNQPGVKPLVMIGTGTWTFDGSLLTLRLLIFGSDVVHQGIPQGNSTEFSMVCSNGWTLNFSRK